MLQANLAGGFRLAFSSIDFFRLRLTQLITKSITKLPNNLIDHAHQLYHFLRSSCDAKVSSLLTFCMILHTK